MVDIEKNDDRMEVDNFDMEDNITHFWYMASDCQCKHEYYEDWRV